MASQHLPSDCASFVVRNLFRVLGELRDGSGNAQEGHAERRKHEGADARRALLDVVADDLQHWLRRDGDGPDRVAGERLVDSHAGDAHHGGAAVVALGVELELLAGEARRVVVPHPDLARLHVGAITHITRRLGRVLGQDGVVQERNDEHNLDPRKVGERRP